MPVKLIAAPHTPFHSDGRLNLGPVALQAAHYRKSGVSGVFVAGTTGEASSLSVEERLDLAGRWVETGRDAGLRVIVHVGHACQGDAIRLAAHAAEIGADAVSALAPYYFKPAAVEDLVDFCVPVAAAAGALPFYFYDIPVLTGVSHSTVELLRQAPGRIPTFAGVKFTKTDLVQFQECLRFEGGRYEMLYGSDETLLAAYALGGRGGVGSTYNVAAPLYHRMIAAFDRGDGTLACELQAKSVELVRVCEAYGFQAAAKAAMSLLGIDLGPVRPPLRNLSPDQIAELRPKLERLGVIGAADLPAE